MINSHSLRLVKPNRMPAPVESLPLPRWVKVYLWVLSGTVCAIAMLVWWVL